MASVRKLRADDPKSPWVVEYTDQFGKRRRLTPKSGLKKDADRERLRVEMELEAGVHTAVDETRTFAFAADAFERDFEERVQLKDNCRGTLIMYISALKQGARKQFSASKLTAITQEKAQEWVTGMRKHYSAKTIRNYYEVFQLVMDFAVKKRWLRRNVLHDDPCKLPQPAKRQSIPTREDIRALMVAIDQRPADMHLRTFVARRLTVALGVFGGLRPGEIRGLQWENVDFVSGIIRIRHSLSIHDGLKAPKSKAGLRDVPMSPPIRRALLDAARFSICQAGAYDPELISQSKSRRSARLLKIWADPSLAVDVDKLQGPVALGKNSGPRGPENSSNMWPTLMKEAGLCDRSGKPKFTPHAMRHAAASLFIAMGLPAINLKAVIGHASVKTTYDVYGHLFPDDTRTADVATLIAAQFGATETRHLPVMD